MPFCDEFGATYRCPLKQITAISWEYINAFSLYHKSILPNGVGFLNESKKYLDAMMVIENEKSRINEDEMQKKRR